MARGSKAEGDEETREEMWVRAGKVWLGNLQLREPIYLESAKAAKKHEAEGVLACISALTFTTLLNMHYMRERGVDAFLYTFMAHEIGHHAVAPAGFTNQIRLLAAAAATCPESHAPGYVNLALDLLINDYLYQEHQLPVDAIYRRLTKDDDPRGSFRLMLRAMEVLWGCEPLFKRVEGGEIPREDLLTDALVATYSIHGEGRRGADLVPFVALATRIMMQAEQHSGSYGSEPDNGGWDILRTGQGGEEEAEALRRWLRSGGVMVVDEAQRQARRALERTPGVAGAPNPNYRNYAPTLLQGIGIGNQAGSSPVSASEVVVAYYETLANGHLFEFLSEKGGHNEGYPESLREWAWGEPLEDIDWVQTAVREGNPLPGINTVAWEYGYEPEPIGMEPFPVDLDLYIDTSGSMPDPKQSMSHIALGAFIFAMSVLRQGGAVRVTIWSYNMDNLLSTDEFLTDRDLVLETICYSIRGGTQFPVEHWERAVDDHKGRHNQVHTVILSDDGISTWFHGSYKTDRVENMLARVQESFQAGGTVILNGREESLRHDLPEDWLVRGCRDWHTVVSVCAEVASRKFG